MKLFLDTADYTKIAEYASTGLLDGVTINPTLLKIQNEPPLKIVREIIKVLPEAEISLQVTEHEPHKVYEQAKHIANLADNMLVKIPCAGIYLPVIAQLIHEGIPVNATLVFNVTQAFELAQLGVDYISLFVGRLYDNGVDGLLIADGIQKMLERYGYHTELLIASVRTREQVEGALSVGAGAITMPVDIFSQLIESPYTQAGLERFKNDWEQGPHKQLLE